MDITQVSIIVGAYMIISYVTQYFLTKHWIGKMTAVFEKVMAKPLAASMDVLGSLGLLVELQTIMSNFIADTEYERFLVLKGHNGGSIPSPRAKYYVSVIHSTATSEDATKSSGRYTNLEVDLPYLEMLENVTLNGVVGLKTSDMQEGILKRIYEKEGVVQSYVFFISRSETELYYGSISRYNLEGAELQTVVVKCIDAVCYLKKLKTNTHI